MSNEEIPIEAFLGNIADLNGTSENYDTPFFGDVVIEDVPAEPPPDTPPPLDEGGIFDGATTKIGDGECLVCGSPTFRPAGLTKAGHRKRVPKYCDLHAPNNRISQEGPFA